MIEKAVFLGSKKFGLELFKALYRVDTSVEWTLLCPPDLNDLRTCFDEFGKFARAENIDLLTADSPEMVVQFAKDHNPDVIIVCGYYRILPAQLFQTVRCGVWGIHNSLLPKYRGGSPLVWQIINREKTLGSSFFKFAESVDDGPILDQVSVENSDNITISEASDLIELEWIKRVPELWKGFCDGSFLANEQDHSEATYCAQRQEFDGEIDWHNDAALIDAFIRSQASPYPGSFFMLDGKKVKIVKHRQDNRVVYGTVGQVFEVRDDYVTICCGNHTVLRLNKLEIDAKVINANELLSSIEMRI